MCDEVFKPFDSFHNTYASRRSRLEEAFQCGFITEDGENLYFEYNFEDENWRDGIPDDVIDFAGLDSQYEDYLDMMSEEEDEE